MKAVSLQSQIAAVQNAAHGDPKLKTKAQVELHLEHLRAAMGTLRWLKKHEAEIKAFVRSRKGGDRQNDGAAMPLVSSGSSSPTESRLD